ncbi:MAG: hypothetical protein NWE79_08815 [Candidatus Bathyarchaeota archaeon]|nr:hypothetical protein [Candidatus Bathyarchaeota archaeon]
MEQGAVVEAEAIPDERDGAKGEALVICRGCGKLVPRTMMCLYCGAPILFRKPRRFET